MGKIGKLISSLIILGLFGSWFTFTIWGIVQWNNPASFVSQKTTISLLYVPLFIGMFILFIIFSILGSLGGRKKKKKKEGKEEVDWKKKMGDFLGKKSEDTSFDAKEIEKMIPKEVIDKITKFIKEKADEES